MSISLLRNYLLNKGRLFLSPVKRQSQTATQELRLGPKRAVCGSNGTTGYVDKQPKRMDLDFVDKYNYPSVSGCVCVCVPSWCK